MRKPDKPALVKAVTSGCSNDTLPTNVRFVLDGGSLLHRVRWVKGSTFLEISQQYVTYVLKKYGEKSIIVFDGYMAGPSVKDHEHQRRAGKDSKLSPDVLIDNNKPAVVDQQTFLTNESNKNSLIQLLIIHFNRKHIETFQFDGDADTDIVLTALRLASACNVPVCVVANDTAIMALLLYHVQPGMPEMYFVSETKKSSAVQNKFPCIQKIQQQIGEQACKQILAIHAFGGCDTVSAIFGHGKGAIFKKVVANKMSNEYTEMISNEFATREDVGTAGGNLMKIIYGGKPNDDLNKMRYASYCKMAASSLNRPQPERLPPTANATYFHSLRAHFQTVVWKMMNTQALQPKEWDGMSKNIN